MTEMTFYPSLDGDLAHVENPAIFWQNLRVKGGTDADTSRVSFRTGWQTRSFWEGLFHILSRQILIFDTSSIPDDAVISSASLHLLGSGKSDPVPNAPTINIYSASPASETELVAGDFNSLGFAPYCDTTISYANWDPGGFNVFVLNAIGLAAISKTGKTVFGVKERRYDSMGAIPSWRGAPGDEFTDFQWRSRGNPDAQKPKLLITYAPATPYFLWGEGLKLDFTDHFGNKRRLLGTKEGVTGKNLHQTSIQGLKLGYIDIHGDERRLYGTKQGFTGKSPYQVSIQGTKLAFIDENGDERYIDTGARGNSNAFNTSPFN